VLRGSCRLEMDNGVETQSVLCGPDDFAVLVGPGVWRCIRDLAPSTLIMVAAELSYGETQYFDQPVPALVRQQPDIRP
ncbi:MAG: WxcM-like domain-containing protein, partial [Mesorhizobium sp.]|nr:WxcM-like domain-containing protein [Mesorhizobium sp.]